MSHHDINPLGGQMGYNRTMVCALRDAAVWVQPGKPWRSQCKVTSPGSDQLSSLAVREKTSQSQK